MDRLFSMHCIAKHVTSEATVTSVPSKSLKNFFLDPWAFDFSESSKYGAVGRFPSNHQYGMHFMSFWENGLESHREAIDVKFTTSEQDKGLYKVHPWSVGFVDGQTKVLIVQSILGMLIHHEDVSVLVDFLFLGCVSPIDFKQFFLKANNATLR